MRVRALAFASVAGLALALAACGDSDADQRKAFISFLQTRILDKPGIHVPQLTEDERKSFGPYAAQYAIITDFHDVLNRSVSTRLSSAMTQGAIQSVGDLVARRDLIQTARTSIGQMASALGDDIAHADDAHGKLNQPPELKATFDKAYERLVTVPAATFKSVAPVADKAFADALDFGAYIDQHKSEVTISGPMVQASNAQVRDAINAKLQGLQTSQQAVQRAQADLQRVVYGSPK